MTIFLVFLAGLWGAVTAGLIFYAMGLRVRIHLLQQDNDTLIKAISRPTVSMFTKEQIQDLAHLLSNLMWTRDNDKKTMVN